MEKAVREAERPLKGGFSRCVWVACGGYSVQNTLTPGGPAPAVAEARLWYQWYFNTERGRAGLEAKIGGHPVSHETKNIIVRDRKRRLKANDND